MKKQYSLEEIFDVLKNSDTALDSNYGVEWGYYLHHNGENFVPHSGPDNKTFYEPAPYVDELSEKCSEEHPDDPDAASNAFWNTVYTLENADNEDFMSVVSGLCDQVNEWLEEQN